MHIGDGMRIDELLYTEREGNTIHLGVKDSHNAIFLLGTSVRSKPGRSLIEDHKRITFYPEEGKEGIIALCVPLYPPTLRKRQDAERIPTFLKLSWDEGSKQHTLAILETWILPERTGFVTGHGISVTLQDGTNYVTPHAGLPGTPADTNLLCKYLAGEVSDDDVRNAVPEISMSTLRTAAIFLSSKTPDDLLTALEKADQEDSDKIKP